MWTVLISIGGTLAGTLLGVMLEPLRNRFTARARRQERLLERCELLVDSASDVRSSLVELNGIHRRLSAGRTDVNRDQMNNMILDLNAARNHVRRAAAMLRLHGPEELADQADAVRRADTALFRAVRTSGSPELAETPEAVTELAEALDVAVREFAVLARRHTA